MLKLNKRVGTFCINTGGTAGFMITRPGNYSFIIPGAFYFTKIYQEVDNNV